MIQKAREIINYDLDFLPLKIYANIHEGNALRLDWKEICPQPDYVIDNPPFVGARIMNAAQKFDHNEVFNGWRLAL